MRERDALDEQLNALGRIERELDDQLTMIELGESEKDDKTVADAEAALKKLKAEVARRELEALLSGEADANDAYPRSPCRRRRHREPGLGRHADAHVRALGRSAWLQSRLARGKRRRGRRHQVGDRADQGPQRLWLAQDRGRRAPAGAHLAVRRQCAAAHVVRQRRRVPGDRRPHQDRNQRERRAHRRDALGRRRRPARQQDRVGGAPDAHSDQHRGQGASRTARSTATAPLPGTCCGRGCSRRR